MGTEKLDLYRVSCSKCYAVNVVYVPTGTIPRNKVDLGGFKWYPNRYDEDEGEYHLCPECQRSEPHLTLIHFNDQEDK